MGKGKKVRGNSQQRKMHSNSCKQTRDEKAETSTSHTKHIEEQEKAEASVKKGTI